MLKFTTSGDTHNTDEFLNEMIKGDLYSNLERFAKRGVDALSQVTPKESGKTAQSWDYEIIKTGAYTTIWWINTNVINGFNVAIGLQYGHGTGTGGWVAGQEYINQALKPIFDEIADDVWKEVQKA